MEFEDCIKSETCEVMPLESNFCLDPFEIAIDDGCTSGIDCSSFSNAIMPEIDSCIVDDTIIVDENIPTMATPISFLVGGIVCQTAIKSFSTLPMSLDDPKMDDAKTTYLPFKKNGGKSSAKKVNGIKGKWTLEEDKLLAKLVEDYGIRRWSFIADHLIGRKGKQCRERWHNHLRPNIKKDTWSEEEDRMLIQAHTHIGNRWAEIARYLPGRTENSIKNHWNATKRRQYSHRRCRSSKNPRPNSLLMNYIKSLNLPNQQIHKNTGSIGIITTTNNNNNIANDNTNIVVDGNDNDKDKEWNGHNSTDEVELTKAEVPCENDQIVPAYDFSDIPDFVIDVKPYSNNGDMFEMMGEEFVGDNGGEMKLDVDASMSWGITSQYMKFECGTQVDMMEMKSEITHD